MELHILNDFSHLGENQTLPAKLYMPFNVSTIYPKPYGKHDFNKEDIMLTEYSHWIPHIYDNFPAGFLLPEQMKVWKEFNLYEYAHAIQINLPAPRIDAYLNSNFDVIQESVIGFANPIFFELGWNMVCYVLTTSDHLAHNISPCA